MFDHQQSRHVTANTEEAGEEWNTQSKFSGHSKQEGVEQSRVGTETPSGVINESMSRRELIAKPKADEGISDRPMGVKYNAKRNPAPTRSATTKKIF